VASTSSLSLIASILIETALGENHIKLEEAGALVTLDFLPSEKEGPGCIAIAAGQYTVDSH